MQSKTELFFEKGDVHDLVCQSLEGQEGVSELFEFRLLLQTQLDVNLEHVTAVLLDENTPAILRLATPEGDSIIVGLVSSVVTLSAAHLSSAAFEVTIVPRIWRATRTRRSRLYENMTVPEIVKFALEHDYQFRDGDDFELHCVTGHYPKEEYLVQYEESDWTFLSRLMEYYGISYYFRFDERSRRDVLHVVDSSGGFQQYVGPEGATIPFNPAGKVGIDDAYVTSISRRAELRHPNHVLVLGYDYEKPKAHVVAEKHGHASTQETPYCLFWEDCSDPKEASFIAHVRQEELEIQAISYKGETHVSNLRPGQHFRLDQHFDPVFVDRSILVTRLVHQAKNAQGESASGYRNSFEAVEFGAVTLRPKRRTPCPRIDGVMFAKIASREGTPTAGEIDRWGRYRVIVPYPTVTAGRLHASHGSHMWIRMAQPNASQRNIRGAAGFHMPLHAGTEVLLVHVNGDPDRPIIAGAVPNHLTQSPLYESVATRGGIKTRSGITIQYDDDA